MGVVTGAFIFTSDTETVTRTKLNDLSGSLLSEFNGNIEDANIKSNAGIVASKLILTSPGAIGTVAAAAGTFTTLISTGDTTIGNASGDALTFHPNAWTLSNNVTITGTWADLGTVTTIDINGGSIDGAAVGANSATTIKGTTIEATTSLKLATGVTVTGIENNDSLGTSDTKLCTQGNVKAYADALTTGELSVMEFNNVDKNNNQMRICGGIATLSSGTIAITGLPFSSSTSYSIIVVLDTDSGTQSQGITVIRDSASQATVTDSQGTNKKVHWIAIGT